MDIPHEKHFHFRDGTAVGSLDGLKEKLEGIGYQEFYHHVNDEKNDFANWVRHVLDEEALADDLEKVTSIVETVEILENHLHPRPLEETSEDLQTKIEDEIGVHVPVEDVPTTAPQETTQIEVLEEHEHDHGEPDDVLDEDAHEDSRPHHAEHAQATHDEHVLTQHDYTKLIVKDFMYGLIFGLIIGLILGRILSF